jgi:hypothetical protein
MAVGNYFAGAASLHPASVACTSVAFCGLVGQKGATTAVEFWNGRSWQSQTTALGRVWGTLIGISCTTSTSCLVVGGGFNSGLCYTIGAYWKGTNGRASTPT